MHHTHHQLLNSLSNFYHLHHSYTLSVKYQQRSFSYILNTHTITETYSKKAFSFDNLDISLKLILDCY